MNRLAKRLEFKVMIAAVAVNVIFRALSALTGFGTWADNNPLMIRVGHTLGALVFGVFGFFALVGGRHDPEMRRWLYRFFGVFFLLIAIGHAVLLFSGKADFSSLSSE